MQTTIKYIPIIDNRFIVSFPHDKNFKNYVVESVSMPHMKNGEWENTNLKLRNIVSTPAVPQFVIENLLLNKNFEMVIEFLDPAGGPIQKWIIEIEKVISADFGGVIGYSAEGNISVIDILFKTKKGILVY